MRHQVVIYCRAPDCNTRETITYDTERDADVQQAILRRKAELGWNSNCCPLHTTQGPSLAPSSADTISRDILVQLTRIADALEMLTAPSLEQAVANHQLASLINEYRKGI